MFFWLARAISAALGAVSTGENTDPTRPRALTGCARRRSRFSCSLQLEFDQVLSSRFGGATRSRAHKLGWMAVSHWVTPWQSPSETVGEVDPKMG
jgi:hypothetical protein